MSRLTDWQIDEALRYCGPEPDKLIPIRSGYYRQALTELQTLRAENARLRAALEVPEVWTEFERDGMVSKFMYAYDRHGISETLFSVAAWLLRERQKQALNPQEGGGQ